jgi:aspartate carbamoyltransferase catalytic subunit
MPNHFVGWHNTPEETVLRAIRNARAYRHNRPASQASLSEQGALCVLNWKTDPVSIRLQEQLQAACKVLNISSFCLRPHPSDTLAGIAETLAAALRTKESPCEVLAIRHRAAGVTYQCMNLPSIKNSSTRVFNAGDGGNEDPITALALLTSLRDLLPDDVTMYRYLVVADGVSDAVARSVLWLLSKIGVDVELLGHPALAPLSFQGVRVWNKPPEVSSDSHYRQVLLYFPVEPQKLQEIAKMSVADYEDSYVRSITAKELYAFCFADGSISRFSTTEVTDPHLDLSKTLAFELLSDDVLLAASLSTLQLVLP